MTQEPQDYSIILSDLTKEFPENGIKACNRISFSVKKGEILAIMGENGAGKSTLMHILSGFYRPDEGSLSFPGGGQVGMIHQKPILAGNLTVWENIALGHREKSLLIHPSQLISRINKIQSAYSLPLDLNRKAGELSSASIQRAELLECLLLNREILVFDEPSASLTDQQTEELMTLIRQLRREGKTILYITHKIQEVYSLADRIAIIRKGILKLIRPVDQLSPEEISASMIGTDKFRGNWKKEIKRISEREGTPLLQLKGICYTEQGSRKLENIHTELYAGEILGVAGIRENGLVYLEDLITGAIRPDKGEILLKGREIPYLTPYRFRKHGISYIPADRLTRGASLDSTLGENLILLKKKLSGSGRSYRSRLKEWTGNLISKGDISGHPDQPARTLSGGNIQKMILTRELHEAPALLIISEPSWGLDFNSREKLHRQILEVRKQGGSVLLLTTDIDELLLLSDRIAVLTEGELTETPPGDGPWTRKTIGERMTGADRL